MNTTFEKDVFHPTVKLETSPYGTPTPRLWIAAKPGTPYRRVKAALHAAAMVTELEAAATDHFVVGIEVSSDLRGCVYLETVRGTDGEAARGLAVLRRATELAFT
jgi:hypothetical protein